MAGTGWVLHGTHGIFRYTPGRHFLNHQFTGHMIIINSIFSLIPNFFNKEGSVGAETYLILCDIWVEAWLVPRIWPDLSNSVAFLVLILTTIF